MRRLLFFLFIIPFYLIGSSQNRAIDSLVSSIYTLKIDSLKYKGYVRIADAYADSAYDKSLLYFNKALYLAEKSSKRTDVAHVYHKIGSLYLKKGELPTALTNFNNALEIHEVLNNKKGIGQLLNDIGLIYKTWGKYDKALDYYLRAMRLFDEIGDDVNGAMASNNIGQIFYYRNEYEKSIEYFKKYLEINNKKKTMRAVAGAANNIASAYLELDKLDNALEFYIRALRIYDSLGIKVGVAVIKDNIGSLYLRKKQYNDALLYNTEASKIFEEIGSPSRLSASLQCVGLAYTKLNQPDQALKALNQSLDIAINLKQQETKKDVYETLAEVYSQTKEFDKALLNYKLFVGIKDSLLNSETIGKIESIQAEYESQKKEKDIAEINQKLYNQKVLGLLSIGIIILFLFLTALIVRENQQKKRTIKIAEEQANNLYQIIGKTNQNLILSHTDNISASSIFNSFWHISSIKNDVCSCIPFFKDSYLIIAFVSKGYHTDNEDIIKLSLFDFFSSLSSLNFSTSIKEQYNSFISNETTWKKSFGRNQVMNIDFWCYNKDTEQQLFSGIISAYHVIKNRDVKDLSKESNTWLSIDKGDRLFFCTSKSLNISMLNEQEYLQSTISKTIAKTLDISFDEQKEILANNLELIESGHEQYFGISIAGFLF
ncbi:MAG: tetratricopeptide repeat protein [Bacteroidales bacterium]|nr:MAG: tetratricopeptide repeat protein [Bacteroidales bacterium]